MLAGRFLPTPADDIMLIDTQRARLYLAPQDYGQRCWLGSFEYINFVDASVRPVSDGGRTAQCNESCAFKIPETLGWWIPFSEDLS